MSGPAGPAAAGWRGALAVYRQPRVLLILPLGFASGLPLLLTSSTLSLWLKADGVDLAAIGAFALAGLPYTLKFLWSPLLDRLPPPLPLGRRRGWAVTIQIALVVALLALAGADPAAGLGRVAGLALLIAFLSASQDIVIDAYRVEILALDQQGAGAAFVQVGYRVALLVAGAGGLVVAQAFGWFAAYAAMAGLMAIGLLCFLFGPEPDAALAREGGGPGHWLRTAVLDPFADFARRPAWAAILVFIVGYKLGEALAGWMANPLYKEVGFSLDEIAAASKLFGFAATMVGVLLGGLVSERLGIMRALLACGILQSLGNLAYIVQAEAGHHVAALALCVAAENLTGGMAATAMVAFLSSLCSPAYTATQYALLSSLAAVGRALVGSLSGVLAERLGWDLFFLVATVITLPALGMIPWLERRFRPRAA